MLPDGVTHTKGFIKNPDEAQRYLTSIDGSPSPLVPKNNTDLQENTDKPEERRKADLTKNVISAFLWK